MLLYSPMFLALCLVWCVMLLPLPMGLTCVSAQAPTEPCTTSPYQDWPYCNTSLPIPDRVADLISRMTLAEKLSQLGTTADQVPSVGLPHYEWDSEGLHGLANCPGVKFEPPTPSATSFPQVIVLASSWNHTLWRAVAAAISTEGRGFHSVGHAGLTYFAPNINIYRDPRWGRGQETPGEDPYLTSQYAEQFVRGMQGGEDPRYLKVVATCKHFAAYSLDNLDGMQRQWFNAQVTDEDLYNTYLPAFEACVRKGQAKAVMCSYNEVNGIPACADSFLQNTILRQQWNFDGYVVSDCGAIQYIQTAHNYTNTTWGAAAAGLNGGCDIACGNYYQNFTVTAVEKGLVTEDTIDTALSRLFSVRMQLGQFDPDIPQPYKRYSPADVNTPAHGALAQEVAEQGTVLLTNNNNTLPLDPKQLQTIAIIGPNANATVAMQGNYQGTAPYLISPLAAFSQYAAKAIYSVGCGCSPGPGGNAATCPNVVCNDTAPFATAISTAQQADAVVLVMGLSPDIENEMKDRSSLTLPGQQWQLIEQVANALEGSGKPVILVLMNGGPIALPPQALALVSSILWIGYPGQSGGPALARAVYGGFSPAGRLPYTTYPADYVNQVSYLNMSMRAGPGRTYRYYSGPSMFPFAHGLSYTTFKYSWKEEGEPRVVHRGRPDTVIPFACQVTNTGIRASAVVVTAFVSYGTTPSPVLPLKKLFGFSRIYLQAGESKDVFFAPTLGELLHKADYYHYQLVDELTISINDDIHTTVRLPSSVQWDPKGTLSEQDRAPGYRRSATPARVPIRK